MPRTTVTRRILPLIAAGLMLGGCDDAADRDTGSAAADPAGDSLPAPAEAPDDLAALESQHVETVLSNEYVDVHRVTLPADASISPHQGGPRVVYSLGSYSLGFETDGTSETRTFESGDVHQHEAGVHAVQNLGSGEASFIVFERRDASLPSAEAQGGTPIPSSSPGATVEVVHQDDLAQVHRVTLEPGAQLAPHRGYARAVYSLSEYTLEFTDDDGTREQQFEVGDAHYHDPGEHTVENVGSTPAEFLVVEFMQ